MRYKYRINYYDHDAECVHGNKILCLIYSGSSGEFRSGSGVLPYYRLYEEMRTTTNNCDDRLKMLKTITSLVLL